MVVKKLVLNDGSYPYHNYSVFLKDFDPKKLKIISFDCGDSYIYHINYAKNLNNVNPLYIVIPEVIGFIEERRASAMSDDRKYLIFVPLAINGNVLVTYERVQCEIMNRVIEMSKNTYVKMAEMNEVNFDIALGTISDNNTEYVVDLPLYKLIKVTAMTICCSYVIYKNNGFYPRVSLQETLYDYYWSVV